MRAAIAWGDDDRVDQSAQLAAHRFARRASGRQRGDHALHTGAIRLDDLRMQGNHRRGLYLAGLFAEAIALLNAPAELRADLREVGPAVRDRGDQARDGGLGLLQLAGERLARPCRVALPHLALLVIFPDQQRHGLGRQQLLLEPGQDAALQLAELEALAVAACARLARADAAEPAVRDDRHIAAARAAPHQSREDVLRSTTGDERRSGAHLAGILCRLPEIVVDDPQFGQVGAFDLGRCIDARHAEP